MPLVAWTLGAYVAGLYAGFSHAPVLFAIVSIAAALVGLARGVHVAAALTAVTIAGVATADAATRTDATCIDDILRAHVVTVTLAGDASPGAFIRGRIRSCGADISIAVDSGEAAEGARVVARGLPQHSNHGITLQHAVIATVDAPSVLRRARAACGRAIDRTFGEDAPLVRALLIADRHELSPEIRDRYAAAGLAHILAIAGLHIGIVGVALAVLFDLLGFSRQRASVATIVAIILYVAMIGAPVPAVRSATMLTALFMTRLLQRPTSRWAIVALGAGHAVIDPRIVLDVGYQLSVVGVSSMIAAGMLGKRLGIHAWRTLAKAVALTLLGTTVATIGSAPIVALTFGRVSLIAPLSNLAATPLIVLAQPAILLGLLLSPIAPLARFVADAAHPLLTGLNAVAAASAALPAASVAVSPSVAAEVIAGVLSMAVIVACASREWQPPAVVAGAAAALLAWLPFVPRTSTGMFEIHMIDVGQGDAIALRTPHGHWILIDAGGAWRSGDAGRSTVAPYIGRRGGELDGFILSHPHTDHVGGATSVMRALHPRFYVDAGFPGPSESYRQSLVTARDNGVRWLRAHPGDAFSVDGVALHILAPDSTWTSHLVDPNLASVIVLAEYGNVRALLMGDAERPEEEWLLEHARDSLHVDILKVGHHGSGTSSTEEFVAAVGARIALVSVGAGNKYHLPTPAVMRRFAAHGAMVLRTDRVGTIVARTDGERIVIAAAGDEWELPPRLASLAVPPTP